MPNAVAAPSTTDKFASALGKGLSSAGEGLMRSSQSGLQQALSLLKQSGSAQQILAQLASNPTMYLNNPYLRPYQPT